MYPSAGAEYIYIRKAFPKIPFLSFMIAMILFFAGAAVSSTVALAFAGYLQGILQIPLYLSAIGLMFICTVINNYGVQQSNRVNILFTFIELMGIFIVIWVGFSLSKPVSSPTFMIHKGTLVATSLIFFVYLGFEEIVNLAEEARNPNKDIPKAIFYSLAATTVLYLAISFAVIRLIRPEVMVLSHSPLADAIFKTAPRVSKVMSVIALFSTANTVLVTMLVLSRMVFSMGREGDLPKILGRIHHSYTIPRFASFFVFLISCGFLYLKNFELLVSFSSFATLLAFMSVNIALIVLRYTRPDEARPYLVPLNIGSFPIISSMGIVIGILMCIQFEKIIYTTTFFIFLGCSIYYWGLKRYIRPTRLLRS
jgi:APA family basic amino acid/polyamine antiporter